MPTLTLRVTFPFDLGDWVRRVRSRAFLSLAFLGAVLGSSTALAGSKCEISNESNNISIVGSQEIATTNDISQSFRPAASFGLCGIKAYMNSTSGNPITVFMRLTDNVGTVLTAQDLEVCSHIGRQWVEFRFPSGDVSLQANAEYRITITSSNSAATWVLNGSASYPRGEAYLGTSVIGDFLFETYKRLPPTCGDSSCDSCGSGGGSGCGGRPCGHNLVPPVPAATFATTTDITLPGPHEFTLVSFNRNGIVEPSFEVSLPSRVPVQLNSLTIQRVDAPDKAPVAEGNVTYRVISGEATVGAMSNSDFPQYDLPTANTGVNRLSVVGAASSIDMNTFDGQTYISATLSLEVRNNVLSETQPGKLNLKASGTYDFGQRAATLQMADWAMVEMPIIVGISVPALSDVGLLVATILIIGFGVYMLKRPGRMAV